MLKLIENINSDTAKTLSGVMPHDLPTSYVLFSLLDWYCVNGAWIQEIDGEITALIVEKDNTKLYVTANTNADYLEIAEFIKVLGGLVVHSSSQITKRLGVTAFSKITLMTLNAVPEGNKNVVTLTDDLRAVFNLITSGCNDIIKQGIKERDLKKYNDRAFKEWLAKTSRGIFNGYTQVKAVKEGENSILSVAIADTLADRIYIRDVATDSAFRKMGYATDCVSSLCAELKTDDNEIFLACDDIKTENFYKKLGFERKDYMELGIVEL